MRNLECQIHESYRSSSRALLVASHDMIAEVRANSFIFGFDVPALETVVGAGVVERACLNVRSNAGVVPRELSRRIAVK